MEGNEGTGAAGGNEGAAEGAAAGAGANEGKNSKGADMVSRAEFERVKADMLKHKAAAKEAADRVATENENKLKAEKKWEELASAKEREATEAKTERDRIQTSYLNEKKYNAVHAKVLALGLKPEAVSDLEMLDLEDLQVETTSTGKINILGADKFAERLKARKPHWFGDGKAPKVNAKGQKVTESTGPVTVDDVLKAQAEGKKSGDNSEYYKLHKQLQQQRSATR